MKTNGCRDPRLIAVLVAVTATPSVAQTEPERTTELGTVVVKEKRVTPPSEAPYTTKKAETATWTDTPIADTPLSIQVIPLQVIEDQGATRLKDVYQNVSGVVPVKSESSGIQFETANIRGFSQRMYVDGVDFYTIPPINVDGVQQIEVLKGPSSSLYGAMEVGGLINAVPRLPEFTDRTTVAGEFGSYDYYRGSVDSIGRIRDRAAYRLGVAYENSDSFRDFLHKQSVLLDPSLTWKLSDQTDLTAWLWYQHLDRPVDPGVMFSFAGQPIGPITRNLAGPSTDQTQAIDDVVFGLHLNHAATADLTLRERFLMHAFDSEMDCIRLNSANARNQVAPYYDGSSFNNLEFSSISDALWHLETAGTEHRLLIGLQLARSDYTYDRLVDAKLPAIDLFNPVYPVGPYHPLPGVAQQETLTQRVGGFLQEEMGAFDNRLHLLVGGRADYVDQFYRSWSDGREFNQDDLGLSGRAGVLYDLTDWVSPYVNIGRSFNPNTAGSNNTVSGEPLDPTTGLQYEAGLKFSFLDRRLLFTTAAYQITKDNVPVSDTAHTGFFLNGGELRSRGLELDALGQITPELQVVGSYGYTDTEVLESNTLPVGAPFAFIPLHKGSVWVKYTFQDGPLAGFGLGTGVFASSEWSGNNTHTFDVDGYARWDAGAWYTYGLRSGHQLRAQVNVVNLLDQGYYESGAGQPGSPLGAIGRIGFTF